MITRLYKELAGALVVSSILYAGCSTAPATTLPALGGVETCEALRLELHRTKQAFLGTRAGTTVVWDQGKPVRSIPTITQLLRRHNCEH